MQDLENALQKIERATESAAKHELAAGMSLDRAEKHEAALKAADEGAAKVMGKVQAAYRAATSEGLAHSFAKKSEELTQSMKLWLLILLLGLILSIVVGHDRFPEIMRALGTKPEWGVVLMNVFVSALSLGPAIWLAWIATKQIQQRFRLAEDYGYKAALAKAYEGYRNEAVNLDPLFQAQLFAIALGRLEELPLRVVSKDVAGSPLNDLIQSEQFKNQIKKMPDLKEIFIALLQRNKPKDAAPNQSKDD